mgnify:CR=1 FL=1
MKVPFTKYGLREMFLATLLCGAVSIFVACYYLPLVLVPILLWAGVMFFFRDPTRRPDQHDAFISPADGKVVEISSIGPEGILGRSARRIGIFMSIFDVHVNRSPCGAIVEEIEHHEGGHLDARNPKSSQVNESSTIRLTITTADGRTFPVIVRQIAGIIARRVITDLRVGQYLRVAERIGMVKFGSRVELIIPEELIGKVAVKIGDKVKAGKTVLIYPSVKLAQQGRSM